MEFYAKSNPAETIQEHTNKLIEEYDLLKTLYESKINYVNWNILKLACLYHDMGKLNPYFQNKLRKAMGLNLLELPNNKTLENIPHGYLSPSFLPIKKELEADGYSLDEVLILYQSIYHHHFRPKNELQKSELREAVESFETLRSMFSEFMYDQIVCNESQNSVYRHNICQDLIMKASASSKKIHYGYVMTKGLLNRIDYAASSQGGCIEIESESLLEKIEKNFKKNNFGLNALQGAMKEYRNRNCVVIAPTGAGKTEAALIWIDDSKGFFTLPLKTSINAIFDRVRNNNGINYKNTGLLHSDTISEYYKRNEDVGFEIYDGEYYENTKLMSMPLNICTLDQIIDIVFKYPGYEYKLATLSYSKIVVDEIQMYTADLIAYLIVGLKMITDLGGQFAIFTATFPPIFHEFLEGNDVIFDKVDIAIPEIQDRLRHRIKVIREKITIKYIVKSYQNKKKKILIIANTVKEAQGIYNELVPFFGPEDVNLLHSRFIKKDRAKKEKALLDLGQKNNKETGIWVSTQIVEASLDIDFDELYTELSDITSLFQRLGRVYRNRILVDLTPNVFVYVGEENSYTSGIGYVVDTDIFEYSREAILDYDGKELTENTKTKIINSLYTKEKLENTKYYESIVSRIRDMNDLQEYTYKKEEINLRGMNTADIIPLSIYEENIEEINKIKTEKCLNWKNKIKDFTVTLESRTLGRYRNKKCLSIMLNRYFEIPIYDFNYSFEKGIVYENQDEENSDLDAQML